VERQPKKTDSYFAKLGAGASNTLTHHQFIKKKDKYKTCFRDRTPGKLLIFFHFENLRTRASKKLYNSTFLPNGKLPEKRYTQKKFFIDNPKKIIHFSLSKIRNRV
jgi:hypothetical protein